VCARPFPYKFFPVFKPMAKETTFPLHQSFTILFELKNLQFSQTFHPIKILTLFFRTIRRSINHSAIVSYLSQQT